MSKSRSVPGKETQNSRENTGNGTPFDEEPPDAPFDEPDGAPASPKKARFGADKNADEPPDAMPLNGRTKSLKSIELTKQRTYASAMTETTKKVANTRKPVRDFTNAQINVIKDTEEEESSQNSSPKVSHKRGQTTPTKSSSLNAGKTPVVSPSSPKRRYRTKKAENLGSDDESDLDDWSDEVSALSGIGNEVKTEPAVKGSCDKQKDSRTESSSQSDSAALDNSAKRKDDPKDWTKEQLDSFISKNDWGQVAKYIAESRKSTKGAVPQKKVGGMTKIQQDSASQVSPDDDSVWQSLDDATNGDSEDVDASFDYDKIAARQQAPTVQ